MISIWLVVVALFVHWVADFVFQSDEMANNKSKDNAYLWLHCFIYGLCFMGFGPKFAIVAMFSHVLIDYYTSRLNSRLWKEKKVHEFFVSIGFDQFLHISILLFCVKYLMW